MRHGPEFVAQLSSEFVGPLLIPCGNAEWQKIEESSIDRQNQLAERLFAAADGVAVLWCGGTKDGKALRAALIASGICSRGREPPQGYLPAFGLAV